MTLLKRLAWLAGFLFLLTSGYWVLQMRRPYHPFEKKILRVDHWRLQQGGQTLSFLHAEGGWMVTEGSRTYRADMGRVRLVLDKLSDLAVEDEISDRADRATDFEVNAASGIVLELMSGSTLLDRAVFGKQAPDFSHIYFRYPDKPAVYLAAGIVRGDLMIGTLNNWRSRDLWSFTEHQIVSILIEQPGARSYLLRSSDTWTCNGQQASRTAADLFAQQLSFLKADEFVDDPPSPALAPGKLTFARIVVQTKDASYELHLGPRDAKAQRYPAMVTNHPQVVWIYEYKVTPLLKKPADFLPPTPKT